MSQLFLVKDRGKFSNREGLIGEFYGGLGSLLGNSDRIFPRFGISIGKQF